jgi:hypothetical protein
LKWNINLCLAPEAQKIPAKLRGRPVASNSVIWTGDPEDGRPYLKRVLSFCHPDSVRNNTMPFLNLQTMADLDFPHGRRYYTKSHD